MKPLAVPAGMLLLFAASACVSFWGGVRFLEPTTLFAIGKGGLAVFVSVSGLATFLLKEVNSLVPKQALSPEGLARLRRVQRIVHRRLWAFINVSLIGFAIGSLSAFGDGAQLIAPRVFAVGLELTLVPVLVVMTLVYLPKLFYDLQAARERLDDLNSGEELRQQQLKLLSSKESNAA